mgnify:CR=1 FL=1
MFLSPQTNQNHKQRASLPEWKLQPCDHSEPIPRYISPIQHSPRKRNQCKPKQFLRFDQTK